MFLESLAALPLGLIQTLISATSCRLRSIYKIRPVPRYLRLLRPGVLLRESRAIAVRQLPMARALPSCILLPSLADGVVLVVRRRLFSTVASAATGSGVPASPADAEGFLRRSAGASAADSSLSAAACSWLPDPATGFYRPASLSGEVDVAELRKMLLKHKS